MSCRIVEITKLSECHVNNHQLVVEQEDGTVQIPVEDIEIVICIGAKIRFSTMGLGELNQAGIVIVGVGKKHEPETIIEPYFTNQRHTAFLRMQINLSEDFKNCIWNKIIKQKIDNSSRNLAVLGLEGVKEIEEFVSKVHDGDKDNIEPWRAMVDQLAYGINGTEFNLSLKQRRDLTGILHRSCIIDDKVMNISTAIDLMVDSFKTCVLENQPELIKLPVLLDFKEEIKCES